MNHIGAGGIDGGMLTRMRADVRDLLHDADQSVTAIVATPTSSDTDPASGHVVAAEVQDTVTGYLSDLAFREAAADPRVQVGDRVLSVLAADLTTTPTIATTVRVGDVRHAVVRMSSDPLGIYYDLVLRRTG